MWRTSYPVFTVVVCLGCCGQQSCLYLCMRALVCMCVWASLFCGGFSGQCVKGTFQLHISQRSLQGSTQYRVVAADPCQRFVRKLSVCAHCFLYNVHMSEIPSSVWVWVCVCVCVCVCEREIEREKLCTLSVSPLAFLSFDGQYGNEMPLSCGQILCLCVCVCVCVCVCEGIFSHESLS